MRSHHTSPVRDERFLLLTLAVAWLVCTGTVYAGDPELSAGGPSSKSSIFKLVPTPNPNSYPDQFNFLLVASASADNDIWATGEAVLHWDGTTWTAFTAPNIAGGQSAMQGVADLAPDNVWVSAGSAIRRRNS